MLVLTRKAGETIVIDGCITVTVNAIDGNKVRLGISAPPDVRIDRKEIHQARNQFSDTECESMVLVGSDS